MKLLFKVIMYLPHLYLQHVQFAVEYNNESVLGNFDRS